MRLASSLVLISAILLWSASASAEWVENGLRITEKSGSLEAWPQIASDGAGGAIIVWYDGDLYLWVQRVDGRGKVLWPAGGICICTASGERWEPIAVPDGAGGAIITWRDYRNGNQDIYAQRVNAEGTLLWQANGAPICTNTAEQEHDLKIVTDGAGGAIIAWGDYRNGSHDVYAQRVNASGVVQWAVDGIAVCLAAGEQQDIQMLDRATGGAFVTWTDGRGGSSEVYYQIVYGSGSTAFGTDARALTTAAGREGDAALASDGLGGAIAAWTNYDVGGGDIYAQRIDQSGALMWSAGGVPVCSAIAWQGGAMVVPDGEHGAIIAWSDERNYSMTSDLYAQRVNSNGFPQWTTNGIPLCSGDWFKDFLEYIPDGMGGGIFTWMDYRYGPSAIYCQRVNANGELWAAGGVGVRVTAGSAHRPTLTCDGDAGAIITWYDDRDLNYEIYAQRVERNGFWGYPSPVIADVRDVPGDQGGFVDVAFDASRLDVWYNPQVYMYEVWRAISHSTAMAMASVGIALIDDPAKIDRAASTPVIRVERVGGTTYYWELVWSVGASHLESYSAAIPTLFDSSAASTEYHYFQVIAYGNYYGQFWISPPDSGYSVDNLGPSIPLGLTGVQKYAPAGLTLAWHPNGEIDLRNYAVYRGSSPSFVPSPTSRVASPTDTLWFDGEWRWNSGYYYKVSALDIHGNESGHALLGPDGVTGAETPKTPEAAYLRQNYPNPFNPATRIAFGLAAPEHVSLRIYDAAGRLVRVLVEGARPAGHYSELWDGRDSRSAAVASGIYFYRLQAGAFTETRKMVLTR
jgi:hypothetical protein